MKAETDRAVNTIIYRKITQTFFLILLVVISLTYGYKIGSKPSTYLTINESIDNKTTTVLELTGAATVISTAISAIPDDTATPIAQEFAKLTEAFAIVLIVLFAEKYLMPIMGMIAFRGIIPVAAILFIIGIWKNNKVFIGKGWNYVKLALALLLIIPSGILCSERIDETYKQSIQTSIVSATSIADDARRVSDSNTTDSNGLKGRIDNLRDKALGAVRNYIEAFAVMVVTTIVIPLVIAVVLFAVLKRFTGFDVIAETDRAAETVKGARIATAKFRRALKDPIDDYNDDIDDD